MSAPDIDESDVNAVAEVLRSGCLSLGPKVEAFESAIANYIGVRHAIAVSSGTVALHLIVRSMGLGPGDEVLVPSFTFAASVNALLYEAVTPVFCDIEQDTLNLDPADVEAKITGRTKAIMAVDVFGHPAEWDSLRSIASHHRLKIIDDSCEALGAEYKGRRIGSFGDAAAFAFYPNKQITTGEGGVLVTDCPDIAKQTRSLRNQGRGEMGSWLVHARLGFNYRMDEMSAALGLSQFARIETFLSKRAKVAQMYGERLSRSEFVRAPVPKPHVRQSWFVYVITLQEHIDRQQVVNTMRDLGIPTRCYFPPVHLQAYLRTQFGFRGGELPHTEAIAQRTLALPFYNNLSEQQIDRVVDALFQAISVAKHHSGSAARATHH